MRVITICQADWCNVGYNVAKALRIAGVEAESFKTSKHNFGYEEESKVVSHDILRYEIQKADIVFIMNSNTFCLELCKQLNKKNVYVYHTGTTYRRNPANMNEKFNPYIKRAFTDQTEFIGLGMKDEYYLFTPINTEDIQCEIKKPERKLKIAHYPSNAIVKGTPVIRNIFDELRRKYPVSVDCIIDEKQVLHPEQLDRMSECDVYVELFAPLNEGNKYGCFGVTAVEAASLGKIVVTNHTTPEVYERFYGTSTAFAIPQTEKELYDNLENFILADRDDLLEMKIISRAWAEKYHSYKAYGEQLKKLLYLS